jgi:hypothetical protein
MSALSRHVAPGLRACLPGIISAKLDSRSWLVLFQTLHPAGWLLCCCRAAGGVVVPAFGCPDEDAAAQEVLRRVFPGRRVVGVQTRELLLGGGNIHCITLQQPAA